jgi:hypothetical protein
MSASAALKMARQSGQMITWPWRGSVDVKLTRVRRSLTTFTVEMVPPQTGQPAVYSSMYSASLSRTSRFSTSVRGGVTAVVSLTQDVSDLQRPRFSAFFVCL